MQSKDHGLTVGQLTMAIAALLIASLLWTAINKKNESKNISSNAFVHSLVNQATHSSYDRNNIP